MSDDGLRDRIERATRSTIIQAGTFNDPLQADNAACIAADVAMAEFSRFLRCVAGDLGDSEDR